MSSSRLWRGAATQYTPFTCNYIELAQSDIVHMHCPAHRDHGKATQQRFGSLEVSGNIWQDLKAMRQGVAIETTSMARRRLLMNYEWFPELLSQLPEEVRTDHYCRKLLLNLAELADYMNRVGPGKMSKKKLTQVLASFRPWELCSPDIEAAVQVHRCSTILLDKHGACLKWLLLYLAVYII